MGLPLVPGAKGRRLRYLDDFFENLGCKSDFLGLLVQKVDGFLVKKVDGFDT